MALSVYVKAVENILGRIGNVFVSDDGGTTWYDFGAVQDANFTLESVNSNPDTGGRSLALAFDIGFSFSLQQTSDVEIGGLDELLTPTGNGYWFKATYVPATAATAAAADGVTFKNVLPTLGSSSIGFDGTNSLINISFSGRVAKTALTSFETTPEITFDA